MREELGRNAETLDVHQPERAVREGSFQSPKIRWLTQQVLIQTVMLRLGVLETFCVAACPLVNARYKEAMHRSSPLLGEGPLGHYGSS